MRIKTDVIKIAVFVTALVVLALCALPASAHIPEGWVPIEECSKYCGGGGGGAATSGGSAAKDLSADFVYKAMSDAVAELWDGRAPKRCNMKIVSKLPTSSAEHVIQVIIGQPVGEAPPDWTSEKPGTYEIDAPEGTSPENLQPENFEFTFVDVKKGKEFTWNAEKEIPGIFPEGYFELRNKKARGEELKWYEENEFSPMDGKISSHLTESIGKILSNELHAYAHPLDQEIVPEIKEMAKSIASTGGSKEEIKELREKVDEAKEYTDGIHGVMHEFEGVVEETGKGEEMNVDLHGKAHELMASQYKVSACVEKMEKTNDPIIIKEKAEEIVAIIGEGGFQEVASYMHVHSTDIAGEFIEQLPLTVKDGRHTVEIKYSDLTAYLGTLSGDEENPAPIGGAIAFGIIVVGLVAVWINRRRR